MEASGIAKSCGQVGLASTHAAQGDQIGLVFDKAEAKVVLHLEAVNLSGPVPAKLIEGFDDGESRLAQAVVGSTVAPHVCLAFDEPAEIVHMGPLFTSGLVGQVTVVLRDKRQLKVSEMVIELARGHGT